MEIILPAIKHLLVINTPPQKIYNALTTSTGVANWWTKETIVGKQIGDTNVFKFGEKYHNEMKIIDLIPDNRVEWECIKGDDEWIGTKLIFELLGNDDKTTLKFIQAKWKEETDFFASCNYQWGYYMRSLKLYCESGKGTPFKNL